LVGYDLTRLLIGTEGTLAVITEVTLKLHGNKLCNLDRVFYLHCMLLTISGVPQFSSALRVSFEDIKEAAATARDTLNCGVVIGRCELMDKAMVKISNLANSSKPEDMWSESHTLMYEVTGPSPASIKEQLEIVTNLAKKNNGFDVKVAYTPDECTALWKARKEALWSIMGAYPNREPMITDVCVPLSRYLLVFACFHTYIRRHF
jgi:D-lactate dehydrogenase (cytochrome)